jgi:hypothetical protein
VRVRVGVSVGRVGDGGIVTGGVGVHVGISVGAGVAVGSNVINARS